MENLLERIKSRKKSWNSALKMGTLCFAETFVSTYESTRRHNPEEQNCDLHRLKNLKCHTERRTVISWCASSSLKDVILLEDGCLLGCSAVWSGRSLPTRPDDGGSKVLWNVGKLLPDYTVLQSRRQPFSYSPPWEPQILLYITQLVNKFYFSFLSFETQLFIIAVLKKFATGCENSLKGLFLFPFVS
jgi:hypothetical protein